MDEVARLLTLLALAGGALTLAGWAIAFQLDETRRIRRTLTAALGGEPQPMLVARGRGVGIGFNLTTGQLCVAWDRGGWRMGYRLDELMGVEVIVDRTVMARAFRGEARRPLDELAEPAERVRLRFLFDDASHPDFEMDLWVADDEGRHGRMDADEALAEANRWVARTEALLRRSTAARVAPAAVATPPPTARPAAPAPLFDHATDDGDAATFEDDEDEDAL
jgi:hypothetical protein